MKAKIKPNLKPIAKRFLHDPESTTSKMLNWIACNRIRMTIPKMGELPKLLTDKNLRRLRKTSMTIKTVNLPSDDQLEIGEPWID